MYPHVPTLKVIPKQPVSASKREKLTTLQACCVNAHCGFWLGYQFPHPALTSAACLASLLFLFSVQQLHNIMHYCKDSHIIISSVVVLGVTHNYTTRCHATSMIMDTLTTSARPVAKVPGCLTTQTVSLLSLPCIYSSQTSKCYSLLSSDDTVFALSSGHGKCGRYHAV